jgi:hypothetical protein
VRVIGTLSDGQRGYVYGDIDNPQEITINFDKEKDEVVYYEI